MLFESDTQHIISLSKTDSCAAPSNTILYHNKWCRITRLDFFFFHSRSKFQRFQIDRPRGAKAKILKNANYYFFATKYLCTQKKTTTRSFKILITIREIRFADSISAIRPSSFNTNHKKHHRDFSKCFIAAKTWNWLYFYLLMTEHQTFNRTIQKTKNIQWKTLQLIIYDSDEEYSLFSKFVLKLLQICWNWIRPYL